MDSIPMSRQGIEPPCDALKREGKGALKARGLVACSAHCSSTVTLTCMAKNDLTAAQLVERLKDEHGVRYGATVVRRWRARHSDFPEGTMIDGRTWTYPYGAVVQWLRRTGRLPGKRSN